MSKITYTIEERDQRLAELSSTKRNFLIENLKRGKKTAFANVLAHQKSKGIQDEASLEEIERTMEWELLDIVDSGYVNPETPCECGRSLRYQYIVQNQNTNQIKKFGIVHFEEHVGFPPHIIKAIKLGFTAIDYELDELLNKISCGDYGYEEIEYFPQDFDVPLDILNHKDNEIPLLQRQRERLKRVRQQFEQHSLKKRFEKRPHGGLLQFQEKRTQNTLPFSKSTYKAKLNPNITNWTQETYADYSIILIQSGITSVNEICEILVAEYGANSQRYSTGRYAIFSDILLSLSPFFSSGNLTKTIEPGMRDVRVYFKDDI
ncbi:DUF3895 domain-containing protein [Planococcus maritimus]|uniref:DUF3895 domain-containing protein n=1 Tax=Planococcus maritimus TaxID=192421 RepID=UPI00232C8BD7|nr:DUF3895 domain-containing protein [Planococcus maritimus]